MDDRLVKWLTRSVCVVALAAAGCSSSELELAVDLKTDYVAGVELASVETTLLPPDAAPGATGPVRTTAAFLGENFTNARRVADFGGLAPGAELVRVRLRDRAGATIATRDTRVDLRASFAITVVITRDCRDVHCPSATGDPAATECVGGQCVAPTCSPEIPGSCPAPQCSSASTCPPAAACAVARCESGSCLYDIAPDSCTAREWCSPVDGCMPLPTDFDAGVRDAGVDAGVAGVDAGVVAIDAGVAGVDAGAADAGPAPAMDAGLDAGTDAGGLTGGSMTFTSTTDTRFVVPPGITRVVVLAWGAGGGGGGGDSAPGGDGGGGGFAMGTFDVTPGAFLAVHAGGGGEGGRGRTTDIAGGGGGGASTVASGPATMLVVAPGGGGGGGVNGGSGGGGSPGAAGGAGGGASGVTGAPGGPQGGGGGTATAPGVGGVCACGAPSGRAGVGVAGGDGGDARGGAGGGGVGGARDGGEGGGRAGGGGGGGGHFGGGGGHAAGSSAPATGGGGGSASSTAADAFLEAGSGTMPGGAARPELGIGFAHGGVGGSRGDGTNGERGRVVLLW